MVSERAPSLTQQRGISRLVQKPAPLREKAGDGHRTDAGVALEHLDERVLHGDAIEDIGIKAESAVQQLKKSELLAIGEPAAQKKHDRGWG